MKTPRVVNAVGIGVAIGVVAGLLNCKRASPPTDPCLIPGHHTIEVASNGSVSCPTVVVRPGDRITWHSPAGTRLTRIVLQKPNLGQPSCPPSPGNPTNVCDYTAASVATTTDTDYDGTLTGGSPNPAPINARIIIQR